MYKKKVFLIYIFLLFLDVNANNPLVKKIEQQFLSNFDWECEALHVKENSTFAQLVESAAEQQKNLKELTKAKIAFGIINKHSNHPNNIIVDPITWDDLSLFRNLKNKKALNVVQKIDRTYTTLGKATLYTMLATPIDNVELLKHRQDILKRIIDNQELFDFLNSKFAELKKHENLFLSFFVSDPLSNVIENQYINFNDDLNKHEFALNANQILDNQKKSILFLAKVLAAVALPIYGACKIFDKNLNNNFDQISERLISSGDILLGLISMLKNNQVKGAVAVFAGMSSALSAKAQYESIGDNFLILKYLQEKLISASAFLDIMSEISAKVINCQEVYKELDVKEICNLLHKTERTNKEISKLLRLLQTNTFKRQPTIFSNWGRILIAYKKLNELKQGFEKALCSVGKIDAFLSMAKLFKEYQNKRVSCCFAQYSQNNTPFIDMKDFWNPVIDEVKAVTNSVAFGLQDNARNIIITGPNEGGKSTIIKSIATNIIFAQTFGIVPAKSMNLTVFKKVDTYINIIDDMTSGNSLFKAQVIRIRYLLDQAKDLKDNEFWFAAFDEPLNGTACSVAQAISYCIAKSLANLTNNICLISTHFQKLSELAQADNNFANYKVNANIDQNGQVSCDFILQKGASTQNTAIEILKAQGFSDTILQEAIKIISN